jgi:hypothetical protein
MSALYNENGSHESHVGERQSGDEAAESLLELVQLKRLATSIMSKEPAEIRRMARVNPMLMQEWIASFKNQQLRADHEAELWGSAIDHIRLSTLSPLKFAAE